MTLVPSDAVRALGRILWTLEQEGPNSTTVCLTSLVTYLTFYYDGSDIHISREVSRIQGDAVAYEP